MKKILIIEDNLEVRENLAEILQLSGYETAEAENGKIGISKVRSFHPDLIICDVMMPELDGFGVLKILNQDPVLMHIPFMFLTAKSEKADFRKGMGLGADDYITKPFDDVELLEAIEMRLRKSEKLKAIDNSESGIRQLFDEAKGEEEMQNLTLDREVRKYRKKDEIYSANQYPKWLYFVVEGQIKCAQTNELGKEFIAQIYKAGDFFGFIPLLADEVYMDTAVAMEDSRLCLIPPDDFRTLLFNNRNFSAKFIKMLARHAGHSEHQLLELAYSSVRKKVANALLLLSEKVGSDSISIMRDDLAGLAGTAKETVIRTLSDFKYEGLIEISDGEIVIKDAKGLRLMPQ